MKVKELLKFLEATDPDCEVLIRVWGDTGATCASVDSAADEKVGHVVLEGSK